MKILSVLIFTVVIVSCTQNDLKQAHSYVSGQKDGYMHFYTSATIDDEITSFQSLSDSLGRGNLVAWIDEHIKDAQAIKQLSMDRLAIDFPWPCPTGGRICDSTLYSIGYFDHGLIKKVSLYINHKEIELKPSKYFSSAKLRILEPKEKLIVSKNDSFHIEVELTYTDSLGFKISETIMGDHSFNN